MTTNRTNRNEVKKYILSQIDLSGYDVTATTDNEKILAAFNICRAEVGHIEKRQGTQSMIEYWFSALPSALTVAWQYSDIIALARQWNSIPENATDAQEQKILNNWFRYMAAQFLQMVRKAEAAQRKAASR